MSDNAQNSRDPRLHMVAATCIVVKDGKFLIAKRHAQEKAFPNRWTVPGGKLVFDEYKNLPSISQYMHIYDIAEWLLRKEVREEVGLEIEKPWYICDLVFLRPDGIPVFTLSYGANYKSGE